MEKSTEAIPEKPVPAPRRKTEPLYTATQLAGSFQAFGTTRAIVTAALKLAGKDSFTMNEAQKLINIFKNKR